MLNVYEARNIGRDYCNQVEDNDHYKKGGIEPMDVIIAKGFARHSCLANIIKYAMRFDETNNTADLRKVSDYAQILCGVELVNNGSCEVIDLSAPFEEQPAPADVEPWGDEDNQRRIKTTCSKPCEGCIIGKSSNAENSECHEWCERHPAEAREIIQKWEVDVEPWGGADNQRSGILCDRVKRVCLDCPLSRENNSADEYCEDFCRDYPAEARAIMDKWEEEHNNG